MQQIENILNNKTQITVDELESLFENEETLFSAYEYCELNNIKIIEIEEEAGEIPITNSVKLYLKQIGSFPILSQAEEIKYAKLAKEGNLEARNKLIEANLRLVVSVAKRYSSTNLSFLDLIQEGNIGLAAAADKFDPSLGFRFCTYATWLIRHFISKAVGEHGRLIKVPGNAISNVSKISKAITSISQETGKEGTLTELASRTGLSEDKILSLVGISKEVVSLEVPVGDNNDTLLEDLIKDESCASPLQSILQEENKQQIIKILDTLAPREKDVLMMRFGFDAAPKTLNEVGELLSLSRERVRQLENSALRKLRHPYRATMLKEYLGA